MNVKVQKRTLRIVCFFTAFLMAFQLIGCGNNTGEEPVETETPVKQEALWQGESFGEIASLTEGSPLYLVDYREEIEKLPDLSGEDIDYVEPRYLGLYQDKIYLLAICSKFEWTEGEDGVTIQSISTQKYFICTFDLNTKEQECWEIPLDYYPESGVVTNDGELLFFNEVSNEGIVEHYYAVYTDMSGNVNTMLDIYPAMEEFGVTPDKMLGYVEYDTRGYFYVRDPRKSRVAVIDETGALIDTMEPEMERAEAAAGITRTWDGMVVFNASGVKGTKKVTTLFWYDDQKPGISILGEIESGGEIASQRYINQYGEIYYSTGSNLVRWNWKTGIREKIFDCNENGLSKGVSWKYCITNESGQLFLLDVSGGITQLYTFSETKPVYEGTIRIADISNEWGFDFIQSWAASFSRKNPLYYVEYDLADHDRIMSEIVSGNGPELLVVNRKDMETLYEKGVIEELSGVLPEDTREQIYSCVLEAGQIEGKQVGLAWYASGYTLYVSRDVWQKDTWNVEEFVSLVEEKEGELDDIFVGLTPSYQTPFVTFRYIAMMDLKNSPFIDWEKGKCYFDSALFRKVLEFSMRYGKVVENFSVNEQDAFQDAGIQELKEGRALAYVGLGPGDINRFSQEMAKLGDDFYSVGFPTGERSGAFVLTDFFFVVNAKAEPKDAIYDFLRYCYDFDTQRSAETWNVRKDVMRTFVVPSASEIWPWMYSTGSDNGVMMVGKPDGSSWLEEYLECMEGSIPVPIKSQEVYDMIQEEVEYYFNGARNMDQTIDVLQRRVQLYLDEHKR